MEKLSIFKFFIPIAIITSFFTGPVLNLLMFLNTWVLESHWSLYIDNIAFANLMTLSFILFVGIFIISMRFVEKISKESFISITIILTGFSSIFAGLVWIWEVAIIVFILTSITIAFLIPAITKYTTDKAQNNFEDQRVILVLPISAIIWIFVFVGLFSIMGTDWRMLFFAGGIINILSTLVFVFT